MGLFGKKKVKEEKKAAPAKKAEPAKKAAPAKKEAPKKAVAPAKKEAPKKAAPAKKQPEPKKEQTRVYHVAKRAEDGKWAVKFAGGEKVIKLFDTKAEAEEYTKKMAENQGGVMLTHASKGKSKGRIQ